MKKLNRSMLVSFFAVCSMALLVGAGGKSGNTISDIAASNSDFRTLVKALKAADMVDTLRGTGPYTVFAPTEAAWAKIPKADLDALLKDKARLKTVLSHHVVAGERTSSSLSDGQSLDALDNKGLRVSIMGDTVRIGDAKVVKPDIDASNGVIHGIDTVLMP